MKIKVTLVGADGTIHKTGRVDTYKLLDEHILQYRGRSYCYQVTSDVMSARFVEVGTPMLITDEDFE